ncbi:malonyl CoA-ACP transacylase [Idiomarina seosinensis]|uniref:[acyl-carrier-protein] S-malonyltransferase n=1 Tax=Idiomarina seosinensis TaxID=281739 RepID=A0A432ZDZ0_9GAMM|nr:malonyl CoA-ACP transacylase [Idiomarina seosinensis]RUO76119.1 malonyl CoA-ACP transacylase [Idiomarina seosinensis]
MTAINSKPTAVVVCPGRGGYNKPELGSIFRHHEKQKPLIDKWDARRDALGTATVSQLDQADKFDFNWHRQADNAAALIYAAGYLDFNAIRDDYNIVAVTGNSMGWYTALACAGVWDAEHAMDIVTDMAVNTAEAEGAQLIYPLVDENWVWHAPYQQAITDVLKQHQGKLFESIRYGGYILLSGTQAAIAAAAKDLPVIEQRFPMILPGHAAFHSSLMQAASDRALKKWSVKQFQQPKTPLIDGRGFCWQLPGIDLDAIRQYTFQHQVTETYDFTRALQVAIHEFAPDHLILLGPGNSLGGAAGQVASMLNWQGITNKSSFNNIQKSDTRGTPMPPIVSLGIN